MAESLERVSAALAGKYRIERELGSGGMATVYLADDLRHPRKVAIKVLRPDVSEILGRERFQQEIAFASTFKHAYVLPLFDSGIVGDVLFYVMPYLEGDTLRVRLDREKQLPLDEALRLAKEMGEALEYAHRRGIVHRDIKPENIFIHEGHAVVADFGIAQALRSPGDDRLTATGVTLGTPSYMSPEQILGRDELDGRSDQYALGCVVYEMLTGQPPFTGATAESVRHQHLNATVRPATDLRRAVPATAVRAITRALSKVPADRFPSVGDFCGSLAETVPLLPSREPRTLPRRAIAATLSLIVLILVAFGIVLRGRETRPRGDQPVQKEWVLLADFEGPSGDRGLTTAARELVRAGLDQSDIVAAVPPSQIRLALQAADKPDSTPITSELARELAFRSTVRTVIEGRVQPVARGFAVVLRAVDVERDRQLFTITKTARDEQDLIPALQTMGVELRKRMGENLSSLEATRSMRQAMVGTPSFAAYRLYARAYDLQQTHGDDRGSLVLLNEALRLDPDFAAAWQLKSFAFNHLSQPDSTTACHQEALRRPHRLSEDMKLELQAFEASSRQDFATADAAFRELERRGYDLSSTFGNHAGMLWAAGRLDEALGYYRKAVSVGPFGAQQWILSGGVQLLIRLGHLDEARAVAGRMSGWMADQARLSVAVAADQWLEVDSLGLALSDDPVRTPEVRMQALRALSAARSSSGAIKAAREINRRWISTPAPSSRATRHFATRSDLLLALAAGLPPASLHPTIVADTSISALQVRAVWALVSNDFGSASRLAAMLARLAEGQSEPGWNQLIQAWLETRAARHASATARLRSLVPAFGPNGEALGEIPTPVQVFSSWILADTYERMSRPDSAAIVLEGALLARRPPWQYMMTVRSVAPYLHRRLVLLHCRMGRLEDARRHWSALEKMVTHPDPDLRAGLVEARGALASAEGLAASARR